MTTWSTLYPPSEALCGIDGCTFLPKYDGPHTWEK